MNKIFIFIAALLLSGITVSAECTYTDDFAKTSTAANWNDIPLTSADGWSWECCQHSANSEQLRLNGSSTPPFQGKLSSPAFVTGCETLRFFYKTGNGVKLKVEIIQEDIAEWSEEISVTADDEWHEILRENLNIEGDFQLVITNVSNGNPFQTGQKPVWLKEICLTAPVLPVPPHNYRFNVPKDAAVYVGDKDQTVTVAGNYLVKHYVPFTKQQEVYIAETDTSRIWYFDLPKPQNAAGGFNYRITRAGKAPHVGLFKPKAGTEVESDSLLVFTDEQLSARDAKDIDHDVTSLDGRNVADILININAQGHLTLPLSDDTAFQIVHTRNWQAIDTDVNNYFIEPDFHYTVIDENGQPSSDIITVSDSGLIRPVGAGTAIVLIDYDAMLCHHTTNFRIPDVKTNPAFLSALWGENTAVFVVSVEQPDAGITTNMILNDYWAQDGTDKTDSVSIDAEHDVMYFEADKGSFHYNFKPEGATGILVATPTVTATATTYSGFLTDSVTAYRDGSYTVRLGFGRNIVKLVSATGATYQVITAKPVTYAVSNITHPEDTLFEPGDTVSVLFSTLYHPANKMSGIYNMSAGIQYTGDTINFPLILGPGQYTFASRAQEYKITIPEDFDGNEYVLTNGVIKVKGFGSYYGAHRQISIYSGVAPNLNASVREAYFGSLPEIRIPIKPQTATADIRGMKIRVYPNPFAEYIIVETVNESNVEIFNLAGNAVISRPVSAGENRINTASLAKGVYLLKTGGNVVKIIK
jgi:hypothetical protein